MKTIKNLIVSGITGSLLLTSCSNQPTTETTLEQPSTEVQTTNPTTEQVKEVSPDQRKTDITKTIIGTWSFTTNGTLCKVTFLKTEPSRTNNDEVGFVTGELTIGTDKVRKFKTDFTTRDENPHLDIYTNNIRIILSQYDFEDKDLERTKDFIDNGHFVLKLPINSNKGSGVWDGEFSHQGEHYEFEITK